MGNYLYSLYSFVFGDTDTREGDKTYYETDDVLTGRPNAIIDDLKNRIHELSRGASVEYIGIASGDDGISAMRSRMDDYKKSLGINEMTLLYQSASHNNVRVVETKLIEYSKEIHPGINKNQIGGGGGRIPNNPKHHYVYAAYRRS